MLYALLKTMRPKHWAKNIFIFAALVFDRKLTNIPALQDTFLGVVLFSLLASTIYIINDLSDIEADRKHPKKKDRPLAAGTLSVRVARTAAVILLLVIFPTAYWLSPSFAVVCLLYFVLNLSYSFRLKHVPLVDVLVLASFYVIRVAAGVTIIQVERFSPWLYLATTFLALFLGIGKRRAELVVAQENGSDQRKVLGSYSLQFLDQLLIIVLTNAILTYSLYTSSAPNLPENHIMMLTIPFVIYGVFRYLYLLQIEGLGETPEDILFSDRPFQINLVLWSLTVFSIFYTY